MRILITGGTGFLGRPLVRRLIAAGHEVRVLSRNAKAAERMLPKGAEPYAWDASGPVPGAALQGVDAVAHCLGENVGQWPWNDARKRVFRESRVDATRHLVDSLARETSRPKVLVSASAVGYYGCDCGDRPGGAPRREGDPAGGGFLAGLVADWEAEVFKAEGLGMRVAALRLGVVLGDGGALGKMLPPFRLGLGAVVGGGRQPMSWVHRTDAAEAFIFALKEEKVSGPVNVCAPEATTNRAFSRCLARALRRPLLFRAPAWAVNLVLGEMGRETLLSGQRAAPDKLLSLGYPFRYPALEPALEDILAHTRRRR